MTKSSSPPTAGDEHASSARGDWRARLVLALQSGAASRDIRDSGAGHFSGRSAASEAFLRRELGRVEAHQKGFVRLLEARVPAPVDSILDVGCSSGSGAIALALSPRLRAQRVVGVDPDASAITAARIRSEGYPSARVAFQSIATNEALPFDDGTFDLTTLV